MPKAPNRQKSRTTPQRCNAIAKPKPQEQTKSKPKDPKASHLYTDDNPSTTLHGTGFKNAATAEKTLELVSKRSLTYQFQTINAMFYRAKNHPHSKGNKDIEAALSIFRNWLDDTYPKAKEARQDFKPLLKKETVQRYLGKIQEAKTIDSSFAEVYVQLPKGKRLANVLVDEQHPEERDWERVREESLKELTEGQSNNVEDDKIWDENGAPSEWLLQCISWAWSPASEKLFL